ncbi:hypothetical protein [Sphingomonas sp. KR3-1]|uniref:hypothetical protein n=1 Tax=Sphingomonas sp. KR3-1 TaxID=3156611 RepID=UPI0032B31D28
MTDGLNRLRNLLSATAWAYGASSAALALLLSLWWGTAHHRPGGGSSLGGPLDLLAITGFAFAALGLAAVPRRNFRLGKRRDRASVVSDPDDPHRMARWGIAAGPALALLIVAVPGPPLAHWLQAHGMISR